MIGSVLQAKAAYDFEQKSGEPLQKKPHIVACTAQDCLDFVSVPAVEVIVFQMTVGFHVADDRLDR